jgi:ABC-type transporter Mla subunit MlaD
MDSTSIREAVAQLSSAAASLDELIGRLTAIADAHRHRADDDLSVDLDEVERALRSAARRLERLVRERQ